MKTPITAIVAWTAASGLALSAGATSAGAMNNGAVAATPNAQIAAPIHQFIDAFNKGDTKTAAAAHWAADLTITDEVPPHVWKGPNAFSTWAHDLATNDAKQGIVNEQVALGAVSRTESDGRHAYVVVPAVYHFKQHGAAMHETAQMTFALRKGPGGWRISAWTWTGPKPEADAPAP